MDYYCKGREGNGPCVKCKRKGVACVPYYAVKRAPSPKWLRRKAALARANAAASSSSPGHSVEVEDEWADFDAILSQNSVGWVSSAVASEQRGVAVSAPHSEFDALLAATDTEIADASIAVLDDLFAPVGWLRAEGDTRTNSWYRPISPDLSPVAAAADPGDAVACVSPPVEGRAFSEADLAAIKEFAPRVTNQQRKTKKKSKK